MRIRPLNDTVIIDADGELIPIADDKKVTDVLTRGLIILPDKNTLMKLSDRAKVMSYGPKCYYKFTPGQEIIYDQFADTPVWYMDSQDEKRYRIIKYHYIKAVFENETD